MRLSNNPVYARLTRDARWPSVRTCVWVALGLAAVTLASGIYELDRTLSHAANPGPTSLTAGAAWLIALSLPPASAITAASLARNNSSGSELDLLRLSHISPAQIVAGFAAGALFRLRAAAAILIGLMPALILGTTAAVMYALMHEVFAEPLFGAPVMQYKPLPLDVAGAAAQIAAVGLGLCLLSPLSAALGVALGMNRSGQVAGGIGVALALAGSLAGGITLLAALHAPMSGIGVSRLPDPTAQIVFPAAFCLGLPALLLPVALWLARKGVYRGA